MEESSSSLKAFNRGRFYDCGRVPPLPKDRQRCFTLLEFLTTSHTNRRRHAFSESGWLRRIHRGQIFVEGRMIQDPHWKLTQVKQRVEYYRRPWQEPKLCVDTSPAEEEGTLTILHIDNHLMAVHKPSGLPTMPSQIFFEYTVLNALREIYAGEPSTIVTASKTAKELIQNHCSAPPQPIHRLGVGTSGVLIVATSILGRQRLTDAIRKKTLREGTNSIRKVYRALVYAQREETNQETSPIPDFMTIDCPIGPVPYPIAGDSIHAARPIHKDSLYYHVRKEPPNELPRTCDAKPALSFVKVIRRHETTAVVEVEIPTGRPHQIRIHMAYAGFPLVDDPLYLRGGIPNPQPRLVEARPNEDEDLESDDDETSEATISRVTLPRDTGYLLHAYRIQLQDPTNKVQIFTATPPALLQ